MDPNAALEEIRKAAKDLDVMETESESDVIAACRLVDAIEALDRWLSNGGSLPFAWDEPWQDHPDAAGWWLLDDAGYVRPVQVHVPEADPRGGRWKRLRIPAGR